MRFIDGKPPTHELTYSEVFLAPAFSDVASRMDVDLTSPDGVGMNIPIVVANMTAVAGRRMAETVARRGGLAVFPQDVELEAVSDMVASVKNAHLVVDTAVTLTPQDNVNTARALISKRSHRAVIVVDAEKRPVGIFTEGDKEGADPFTPLVEVMTPEPIVLPDRLGPEAMFNTLVERRVHLAPVVDRSGRLVGVITEQGAIRADLYHPAVDSGGRLLVGAAVGISGDAGARAEQLVDVGVDVLVVDTAHGHQGRMIEALKEVRSVIDDRPIVAGNVVTEGGVADILDAGADIVKVGVGPGAMCTTRMMTGVGRPQFSAVLECAVAARSRGRHIWADGGLRHPRDVALALAAGAAGVMIGSWFAGTYESAAQALRDPRGRVYKENYGMASRRAVSRRTRNDTPYQRALKKFFEEGVSESRLYLDPEAPGVEDLIDRVSAGVRSACTYTGARTIDEFHERAVVGVQSFAGYSEGQPLQNGW
ncbi:MAG: GuaB1 family IMP dehydrogenase-related protein [bacterium]|nr:GuaB1 family IMP dehydrogenase-related protein [bacterium]